MDAYLYVNRDGTEILSDTLTYNRFGIEEVRDIGGYSFYEIHHVIKDGILMTRAWTNKNGDIMPQYYSDRSDVIVSLKDDVGGDDISDDYYTCQDVTDRFIPKLDKLTNWDIWSMNWWYKLPKGTIKRFIGKDWTFEDGPYKITEENHKTKHYGINYWYF